MGIHEVWRRLEPDQRLQVSIELAALRRSDAGWPGSAVHALARALSFRPKRIWTLKDNALTDLLVRHLGRMPARPLGNLLVHLHIHGRAELLGAVYEALGVEHDGADVSDDRFDKPLDEELALSGVRSLLDSGSVDPDQVGLCLELMSCATTPTWQPVIDRVRDLARAHLDSVRRIRPGEAGPAIAETVAESAATLATPTADTLGILDGSEDVAPDIGAEPEPPLVPCDVEQSGQGSPPGQTGEENHLDDMTDEEHASERRSPSSAFTHLDRLLIDAAVASSSGVEGALDPDELQSLVQEVLTLNAKRKRSWFHRGYVDALHDEQLEEQIPGGNAASRAWYLTGYIQGRLRSDASPSAVRQLLVQTIGPSDFEALTGSEGRVAGALLADSILMPLLRSGAVEEALPWIEAFLPAIARSTLPPLLLWAKESLVNADPEPIRSILEATMRLRPAIEQIHGPMPARMHRDLRRRLAVCLRRAGRFPDARHEVEELLRGELDPDERARLLGDRALIAMGVQAIEDLALPPPDGREAFLEAIAEQRSVLEQAVADGQIVPSALVALALPAVADAKIAELERHRAMDRLRQALAEMNSDARDFWRSTGLLRRCRFYMTLLELREADQQVVSPAVATLHRMFEDGDDLADDLPDDLVEDAVANAVLAEARSSPDVAVLALHRRPHDMIRRLDLRHLAKTDGNSRKAVLDALGTASDKLPVAVRWDAWRDLLRGSLEGGDRGLGAAERALDALEELAERHDRAESFLELLDDESSWSPAWDFDDAQDARVRLLQRLGRSDEARSVLQQLAHRAITDGDEGVTDLLEQLADLGEDESTLESLRLRMQRVREPEPAPTALARAPTTPVSVLFVGGNETQSAYEDALQGWFTDAFPGCRLEFRFSGWGSNWGRLVDDLTRRLDGADALVLMRFVRTGLGRAMRRAASNQAKPWIACSGHGREALRLAIGHAVDRARQIKQKSTPTA